MCGGGVCPVLVFGNRVSHMKIHISIERKRKCGYRYAGEKGVGIYLVGDIAFEECERLPFPLIQLFHRREKVSRFDGFKWIEPTSTFHQQRYPQCTHLLDKHDCRMCIMCNPVKKGGLMWVNSGYYAPSGFINEARRMGVSKRVSFVPLDFEIGVHPVYLAHDRAIENNATFGEGGIQNKSGVFMAFWPTSIDLVIDNKDDVPQSATVLANRHPDSRIVKIVKQEGDQVVLL